MQQSFYLILIISFNSSTPNIIERPHSSTPSTYDIVLFLQHFLTQIYIIFILIKRFFFKSVRNNIYEIMGMAKRTELYILIFFCECGLTAAAN